MEMKTCLKCHTVKILDDFSLDSSRKDGRYPYCKICKRKGNAIYYLNNREKYAEAGRKWVKNNPGQNAIIKKKWKLNNPEKFTDSNKKYNKNNPEKIEAHKSLNLAIRHGRMQRKPCFLCDNPKSHGHHHDYSKPLDVWWMCHKHHMRFHAILNGG